MGLPGRVDYLNLHTFLESVNNRFRDNLSIQKICNCCQLRFRSTLLSLFDGIIAVEFVSFNLNNLKQLLHCPQYSIPQTRKSWVGNDCQGWIIKCTGPGLVLAWILLSTPKSDNDGVVGGWGSRGVVHRQNKTVVVVVVQ